jgi:hypothetical protein
LRRGQESNLPRLLRTDSGFEDREDHQAPFTLRKAEENVQRRTSNAELLKSETNGRDALLKFFDRADDRLEIRPVAGVEFGMEELAIGADFKSAAARWDEGKRFDAFAEFENFGRQTDGLRRVVSNDAVFDRDFRLHRTSSFPESWYELSEQWSRCSDNASASVILNEVKDLSKAGWSRLVRLRALRFDCEIPRSAWDDKTVGEFRRSLASECFGMASRPPLQKRG